MTKNFTAIEWIDNYFGSKRCHVRYRYRKKAEDDFITDEDFARVINEFGGYVYNLCVGVVGDVEIFNGYTWISVTMAGTYQDCDKWVKKLEKMLSCTVK